VLALINAQMKSLVAAPPSAEELKARKSVLVGGFGRSLATTSGLADILGNYALYGVPLDELTRYTARIDGVTAADVQAFAAKAFDPANASVVIVGDAKRFEAALKAARPNLEVIPASDLDLDSPTLRKGGT
jgi:zinc protease